MVNAPGKRTEASGIGMRLEVHRHRKAGSTVVGVVENCDLSPAGRTPCNLHCIFNGFGT